MQVYASSKGFPKYFLAHLFNQMYDLEIIDEEAFYLWKDEINENYPDKGQALFHVSQPRSYFITCKKKNLKNYLFNLVAKVV
jgi:hypothetical protein